MPKKPGRPKSKDSFNAEYRFRCRKESLARWEKAARKAKLSLSAWVRAALDDAAGH